MQNSLGTIHHSNESTRRTDYLYRVSLKCLIRNKEGHVLVNKELGRDYWDLPGGGMDHGEDIRSSIAREMAEEVNLQGSFTYKILAVEEPAHLSNHNFWQIRLIFEIIPENMIFDAGDDSDQIAFIPPGDFKQSNHPVEQRVYRYSQLRLE